MTDKEYRFTRNNGETIKDFGARVYWADVSTVKGNDGSYINLDENGDKKVTLEEINTVCVRNNIPEGRHFDKATKIQNILEEINISSRSGDGFYITQDELSKYSGQEVLVESRANLDGKGFFYKKAKPSELRTELPKELMDKIDETLKEIDFDFDKTITHGEAKLKIFERKGEINPASLPSTNGIIYKA